MCDGLVTNAMLGLKFDRLLKFLTVNSLCYHCWKFHNFGVYNEPRAPIFLYSSFSFASVIDIMPSDIWKTSRFKASWLSTVFQPHNISWWTTYHFSGAKLNDMFYWNRLGEGLSYPFPMVSFATDNTIEGKVVSAFLKPDALSRAIIWSWIMPGLRNSNFMSRMALGTIKAISGGPLRKRRSKSWVRWTCKKISHQFGTRARKRKRPLSMWRDLVFWWIPLLFFYLGKKPRGSDAEFWPSSTLRLNAVYVLPLPKIQRIHAPMTLPNQEILRSSRLNEHSVYIVGTAADIAKRVGSDAKDAITKILSYQP